MALFKFTKAIIEDKPIDVFNYGKHRRDFTYIDDIVEGVVRVLDQPARANPDWDGKQPDPSSSTAPWRIYNIGNQKPIELMDYIAAIEKHVGKKAQKNMLPLQAGDVLETYADVSDLVKDMNYHPATSIDTGIANFVQWYREYYKV
jgi:UDP-glucuronate 4-epimerase